MGSRGRGGRRRRRGRRRGAAWSAAVIAVVGVCVAVYVVAGGGGRQSSAADGRTAAAPRPSASSTFSTPAGAVPTTAPHTASPSKPASSARPTPAEPSRGARPKSSPSVGSGAPSALAPTAGTRVFTFVNHVRQTVWVGAGQQTAQPALATTGWVLPPGRSLSVRVPDHWNGRFWGRTGCSFDAAGRGHCETGDCDGRLQCPGYGEIPASLAEFNLNAWDGLDFYDVSLVDGSNLPMFINLVGGSTKDPISASGCSAAGCTHPVDCPAALRVKAAGRVVGCESPCGVFGTDQYCCRGAWAPRDKCRPDQWPVDYAALFKKAEPFAYSYVDDDATSTFTSKGEAGYRITFGVS